MKILDMDGLYRHFDFNFNGKISIVAEEDHIKPFRRSYAQPATFDKFKRERQRHGLLEKQRDN